MAHSNVEIQNPAVARWMATFDSDSHDFRHTLHPQVEWFPIEENQSRYHGVEEAMRYRERWLETWGEHDFALEEVTEAHNDVVACVHITASGQNSGVPVDIRFYAQFRVRDGKVVLIRDHRDRDAALEAAGLAQATKH